MPESLPIPSRSAGVLLHPTSLPGPFGVGDLGPGALAWIDALAHARQKWWQILPLGPTGYGDSPYQCFSALAGNPYLVSPQLLVEDDLLTAGDIAGVSFPEERVDYGPVIQFKNRILNKAWTNFRGGRAGHLRDAFEAFVRKQADWLNDFSLFLAIKDSQGGKSWFEWPRDLRLREKTALETMRGTLTDGIGLHQFRQFLFFRQWARVRDHARNRGISLIGDIPIFVAGDSADVWANPDLFHLDRDRRPRFVAGVPPDYFSPTGQLWGNPLYDWAALKKSGYAWWIARIKALLELVDVIRLDHFRGFESYWEVPADHPTAEHGKWVKAPGSDLLQTLRSTLDGLPIIAEDLGLITEDVEKLLEEFGLPGMRVLQFAFGGEVEHRYLPHMYIRNTVVYTGTHDNDTTWGWFHAISDQERDFARRYLARDGSDIVWDMIRCAWSSVADLAIVPLQDVLDLGTEARMNMPGRPGGNWTWRVTQAQLTPSVLDRLADMTHLYGRANGGAG